MILKSFQFNFIFFTFIILYHSVNPSILKIKKKNQLWKFPIKYSTSFYVNSTLIQNAIEVLEKETCISFEKVTDKKYTGIFFTNYGMCEPALGKKSKNSPQKISIGQDCNHITDVVHEISHALGVIHEMNRPDRDKYITIIDKNVNPSISSSFESRFSNETLTYDLKYDYGSAMHYDRIAGSTSGKDIVTVPKDIHYLKTIGQRSEIGFNDIKQLNLHYCKEKCNNTLPCKVKRYPNPHNCTECKCPRFYTGRYCDRLLPSDSTCGKRKLIANIQPETFTMEGKKSCYIQILAPVGFKVRLEITKALFKDSFVCEPGTGLEIKYYKDKSVSGAVFCGNVTNNVIFSEGQSIIMRYVGEADNHNINIKYQRFI